MRVLVLAGCGCQWVEFRPPGLKVDPSAPRVCSSHRPDAPGAVGVSPQGMAMVPVMYVEDEDEVAEAMAQIEESRRGRDER